MAGHSHWKQIKEHKGAADKKRGAVFSKLLKAISVASKTDPKPEFNPRLRSAIEKAKEFNVPQENIERAIKKASSNEEVLEDLIIEAYGPNGIAMIIKAVTTSKNKTIQEIKAILKEKNAKWAETGNVCWAFEQNEKNLEWQPKFRQTLSADQKKELENLVFALEDHEDVEKVYANAD
ncbi:MAG: YebC/PmpR family DNA-binding transcriptional regulator [Patescibacteria group bacterium]|nr:YebC/PmpR family DNA-binding transcriptional regulator [Patescibacteria group bacterium]